MLLTFPRPITTTHWTQKPGIPTVSEPNFYKVKEPMVGRQKLNPPDGDPYGTLLPPDAPFPISLVSLAGKAVALPASEILRAIVKK